MGPPIMRDFPESFETERLVIRSPMPGDGPELYAAVRESMEDLPPWMPWPAELAGFRLEGELRNDARGPDGTLRNTLVFSAIPPYPGRHPS